MRQYSHHTRLSLIAPFLLAFLGILLYALPAQAESLSENFVISFEPVVYDRSQVTPGEEFHATFTGHAECNKSTPLPVSEATITLQVVAKNKTGGTEIILNPEYIISVKPFPDKEGETYDVNESIPLQFSKDTEPGEYYITGKLLEAKGKVILVWTDFSGYLPGEQDMGTIKCVLPGTATTTALVAPLSNNAPPTPPEPSTTSTTAPSTSTSTPATAPAMTDTTSPLLPPTLPKEGWKSFFSWWMIIVIVVAVAALLLVFIFGFRRRE
jgi:hypothetical protein